MLPTCSCLPRRGCAYYVIGKGTRMMSTSWRRATSNMPGSVEIRKMHDSRVRHASASTAPHLLGSPLVKGRALGDTFGETYAIPAIVDAARIPFSQTSTIYKDLLGVELASMSIRGILNRNPEISPNDLDFIIYGNVIQECRTSNIAREASLAANVPDSVPATTISLACITSIAAATMAAEKILAGSAMATLVGGCETFSDVPIRFSRPIRQRLLELPKTLSKKGPLGALKLLRGLKIKDLVPETPAIANYTTGETMGNSSDRLASRFKVSRAEQDAYAIRSHRNAAEAHVKGFYDQEIISFNGSKEENGIRGDVSEEKLSSLKPAFVKPHGTHTAANSSYLSDGASAALIMNEMAARDMGLKPRSRLLRWCFVGVDPFESMLLGPAKAITKLLQDSGLSIDDIDVFEIHEAFAGQVLANLKALDSDAWAKENLGLSSRVGEIPYERINTMGGSLSIGHPFAATGVRLLSTATNRLHMDCGQFALIAACADGGMATAVLLERCDD